MVAVGATATRSFSAMSVVPGGELSVTITARGYGSPGRVEETLPNGFSYVEGSTTPGPEDIRVSVQDQTVRFTLAGDEEFTYKVTASSTEGNYTFDGVLKDEDKVSYPVGGDTGMTVKPTTPAVKPTTPAVKPTPPPTVAPTPPPTSRRRGGGGGGGGGFPAAPVSVKPVAEGFISDQTLKVGDAALELSLTDKFKDPRNRALTYAVLASNPAVALAEVKDGYLVITPRRAGQDQDYGDGDGSGRAERPAGAHRDG